MDSALEEASYKGPLGTVSAFPFTHFIARLSGLPWASPSEAARTTEELYLEMLRNWNDSNPPGPYNLLLTRDWVLFVPRSVEKHRPISVNAMGFAGSLLARDERELDMIRRRGPMRILEEVGA